MQLVVRPAGVLVAALTVFGLVGCSTIGESYMRLDYEGDDREKVYACTVAAMPALETAPSMVVMGDVTISEISEHRWTIQGVTEVSRSGAEVELNSWSCALSIDLETRELVAVVEG